MRQFLSIPKGRQGRPVGQKGAARPGPGPGRAPRPAHAHAPGKYLHGLWCLFANEWLSTDSRPTAHNRDGAGPGAGVAAGAGAWLEPGCSMPWVCNHSVYHSKRWNTPAPHSEFCYAPIPGKREQVHGNSIVCAAGRAPGKKIKTLETATKNTTVPLPAEEPELYQLFIYRITKPTPLCSNTSLFPRACQSSGESRG